MPCFSNFCCGYGLRSGGSFIGYFSIIVYVKLLIISVIFLVNIKNRIDESDESSGWNFFNQVSNVFRVQSSSYEIESSVEELKSENENNYYRKLNLTELWSLQRDIHRLSSVFAVWSSLCFFLDHRREISEWQSY